MLAILARVAIILALSNELDFYTFFVPADGGVTAKVCRMI
jgi:hypothetical protein